MMKLEAKKKQQKRLEAEAKKRQELQEAALRVYRQREGSCTTIQKMVSGDECEEAAGSTIAGRRLG